VSIAISEDSGYLSGGSDSFSLGGKELNDGDPWCCSVQLRF
jgi:hypothetical protein